VQAWQAAPGGGEHADLDWAVAEGAEEEEWECVVCAKTFRSEAAWDSHERSKKHLREVERLRREMLLEEEALGLGAEEEEDGEGALEESGSEAEPEDAEPEPEVRAEVVEDAEPSKERSEEDPEPKDDPPTATADDFEDEPRRKSKSSKKAQPPPSAVDELDPSLPQSQDDPPTATVDDIEDEPRRKSKSNKKAQPPPAAVEEPDFPLPSRKKGKKARRRDDFGLDLDEDEAPVPGSDGAGAGESGTATPAEPELSKKDKRRAKEAEKKARADAPTAVVRVPSAAPHRAGLMHPPTGLPRLQGGVQLEDEAVRACAGYGARRPGVCPSGGQRRQAAAAAEGQEGQEMMQHRHPLSRLAYIRVSSTKGTVSCPPVAQPTINRRRRAGSQRSRSQLTQRDLISSLRCTYAGVPLCGP
jgi:hypothetical protein